jgi:hypothetical protein
VLSITSSASGGCDRVARTYIRANTFTRMLSYISSVTRETYRLVFNNRRSPYLLTSSLVVNCRLSSTLHTIPYYHLSHSKSIQWQKMNRFIHQQHHGPLIFLVRVCISSGGALCQDDATLACSVVGLHSCHHHRPRC